MIKLLQQNSKRSPGCSLIGVGHVNKERVDAEEKDEVSTSQVLEAFKQQKFHLEKIRQCCSFVKPHSQLNMEIP